MIKIIFTDKIGLSRVEGQLRDDITGSEEISMEPFHNHKNVKNKWCFTLRLSHTVMSQIQT